MGPRIYTDTYDKSYVRVVTVRTTSHHDNSSVLIRSNEYVLASASSLEASYSQSAMLSLSQPVTGSPTTVVLVAGVVAFASVVICYIFYWPRMKFPYNAPRFTSLSYPLFESTSFFTGRWDFYGQSIAQSGTGSFSFFLANLPVISLSGGVECQVFFESRQLDLNAGWVSFCGSAKAIVMISCFPSLQVLDR